MSILSTREWATLIWGLLFLVYIMCHKEIRKSFWKVIVIFFDKKLRILWEIILLYVLAITMIFYRSSIWENIYIKDIIIWFLFSGLIYCMNAVSSEADERYIQKVLKDNLKLTMILEFFMSTFTFNIWIELAIIPIITIITVMNVIAERKEEYKNVHKLLDFVLAIAGFWILYETIRVGIIEYKELNVINTLVSFMIRKRQTMRLTLNETPLFYERRGFLHSSGSSDDQGIRSSNSAGSIFPCLSQRFGSSVRIYLK